MAYKTIVFFTDLQDKGHPYNVGDPFPREGKSVSEARLNELSSSRNKRGIPLIAKVEEDMPKKKPAARKKKEG
jgi:hypothetical protein